MIVSDNYTIINTQGIRFVEKIDFFNYLKEREFKLRVVYKGSEMCYHYPDKLLRDEQFDALVKACRSEKVKV